MRRAHARRASTAYQHRASSRRHGRFRFGRDWLANPAQWFRAQGRFSCLLGASRNHSRTTLPGSCIQSSLATSAYRPVSDVLGRYEVYLPTVIDIVNEQAAKAGRSFSERRKAQN